MSVKRIMSLIFLLIWGNNIRSVQAQVQSELDKQVSACSSMLNCTITVPAGVNVSTWPWNLRDKNWVIIKGTGTIIWFFASDPAPVVCMDTTGTANIHIEDVTFALGNSSKHPDVLWLHGRGADSRSQNRLSVANAKFQGWFNKATVVFTAVENEDIRSTDFEDDIPNTPSLFLSRDNELQVISQFGPVRVNVNAMTCTNHNYWNCSFGHGGHDGLIPPMTNDLGFGITLGTGVHDFACYGGSTSRGSRGAVMRILGPNNRRISIVSPNWESLNAKSAIQIDGDVYGLTVHAGLLQSLGPAILINGTASGITLFPAEMLTDSILQLGPNGKLTGKFIANEFVGR